MKFNGKNGYEVSFVENILFSSKDISPIKEILERKDFSSFTFDDIPLKETVVVQVNIVDVGAAIYFFKAEDFRKDDFIQEVSKLKEMQANTFYDVLTKVRTLDQVTFVFNPLFVLYNPAGKFGIYEDCFRTLNLANKVIYISPTESNAIIISNAIDTPEEKSIEPKKEKKPKEEKPQDGSEKKSKFAFFKKIKFFNPIPVLKKDKFHFLFALVATFLIGFTLSIGIYNAYAGKLICIFFFICSLAGSFLNFMIYKDAFKEYPIKSSFVVMTGFSSLVGLGISIGGYFIFKTTSNEVLANSPHFLMILAIIIAVYMASSSLPLLVNYLIKKWKK